MTHLESQAISSFSSDNGAAKERNIKARLQRKCLPPVSQRLSSTAAPPRMYFDVISSSICIITEKYQNNSLYIISLQSNSKIPQIMVMQKKHKASGPTGETALVVPTINAFQYTNKNCCKKNIKKQAITYYLGGHLNICYIDLLFFIYVEYCKG